MARPRSADPRVEQVLLRLTTAQSETLDAIAYLNGVTANAYAYDLLATHLARLEQDTAVVSSRDARTAFRTRKAAVVDISTRTGPATVTVEQDVGSTLR